MADQIGGAGGIKQRYRDNGDGSYSAVGTIGSITAGKLVKGGTVSEIITCTDAATDYAAAAAMPAGTTILAVYADNGAVIAMGEATSVTVGSGIGAGLTLIPVIVTGTAADDKVHARSATAGTLVRCTYLAS